ncbi:putative capsule polysaccharide export protein [Sphingomonas sp. MM-1]|uniref:capsule biosynthesis protein n=1 Tax=Sphingomonas sp. MM-1 TaxID=745310 RepID=UPI0002C0B3A5|nr:capsular biosynthesis protein [Sphingomonas sp. MM-1]AGH49927.1 putative capsule polysaccharide export protein [Sphingomonas sp. MM-1]MDX3883211.1 capsular biosynthesis protein [Sphingomonas sp.]
MKLIDRPQRSFLFLQGPPGPFFAMLGAELRARGCAVHRINLNGGDKRDWSEGGVDYRGPVSRWPIFVDRYMRENGITDLMLYGDCRPMHIAAHGMAKLRGIAIHVLEEGYIRPDWMTLEPDGVNGRSTLSRDPQWFLDQARNLPPVPVLPPITASFGRRAHDSYWHYHRIVTGRLHFPYYRPHRPGSIIMDGFGWLNRFRLAKRRAREAEAVLRAIKGSDYFLFPLQLTADYQIRAHSPFGDMKTAAEYVIESFGRHAPASARLVVKEHPLDSTFFDWCSFVRKTARRFGCEDRIFHIDGGDLEALSSASRGMICVNSTSGTLALACGTPVMVLGDAIYDIPGMTHQGRLDEFWTAPKQPDVRLFDAFHRVLLARCLIRGGLASQSATRILVQSTIERLMMPTELRVASTVIEVEARWARRGT